MSNATSGYEGLRQQWPLFRLGDICNVRRGSTITEKTARKGDIPVVAGGIGPAYFHDTPNRCADVITVSGSGANAGFVNFFSRPIWASDCSTIEPTTKDVSVQFVYKFLLSIQNTINSELRQGAAQPHVYPRDLAEIKVPLPPPEEQKRIVAVLDQAFAVLDRARTHAEANLTDATNLFEAGLDQIFGGSQDGWSRENLSELCVIGDGNHSSKYPKKSDMVETGVPFIRSSNIQNGYIDTEDMLFISAAKHSDLKKGHLRSGDILFTNRGEIGKVAIVPDELDGSNLNSQVAWLRCKDKIDNEYLYFFLQSGAMRHHFSSNKSGAALQQFTIKMIKSVEVDFPKRAVQRAAVDRMENIRRMSQSLASNYQSAISDLTNLRQSLLQKAFSGELT